MGWRGQGTAAYPGPIVGKVVDIHLRIFGPFVAAHILHRVGAAPLPNPASAPSRDDDCDWDDYTLDLTTTTTALLSTLDEMDGVTLATFWKEEQLGDTDAKLADWRKLAGMAHPVREEATPDILFSPAVPVLAAITPWLRGAIFSCPHSQRWREQKFSVRSHLTEVNQTEFLKECTMLYEDTLGDFRQLQMSSDHRVRVNPTKASDESITVDSPLPHADKSRKQVAMHSVHLQSLASLYEGIEGAAFGESRRAANAMVAALKERREVEYSGFRERQQELRRAGTTKMTEDPVAAARKEDDRAATWAGLDVKEREFALAELKRAAAAREAANKLKGQGSGAAKKEASAEYTRRKDVIPRLAHGGSLAVSRGEVVDGSVGKKPRSE